MPDLPHPTWRDALDIVVDSIEADEFEQELPLLRRDYGDDPDEIGMTYAGMLASLFITSTGLFAATQLPSEALPAALAEIREALANLDFEKQRKRLKPGEQCYYGRFAHFAAPLFADLGAGMEALFNCYLAGDYDPGADPDDLIAEALEIAEDDLARARHLITRGGAIALHSRPLWWRWQAEAYGPAALWLVTIANLVEDYTGGETPLGSPEEARAAAERGARRAQEEVQEILEEAKVERPAPAPSPVDDLIEELIAQGEEPVTPEQVELCRAHREEAIPALMDLAGDEDLQMEDAPGEGYAPLHAVELLGELKAMEATRALIDIVADVEPEAIIPDAAISALQEIGPPALEPVLAFMRYSWDVETKTALAEVLGEIGQEDERVYETLVAVWEEAAWEEGRSLLAYPLARIGGERAIPLLEEALEDPDLDDPLDYNEVAAVLEELGVEVSPEPAALGPFDVFDVETLARSMLLDVGEPAHLVTVAETTPEEWRSHPEFLAHAYTDIEQAKLVNLIAVQAVILPPEGSLPLTIELLEELETLTFEASTQDYPRWLRKTYTHLAECAGPDFQLRLAGVLLSLRHHLSGDYDIADDPDQLLAAARELPPEDEQLRQVFGRAGALILHGRSFWSRWPDETARPLCAWLEGLTDFRRSLERVGQIPLRSSLETGPEELSMMLMEALVEEEPPPPVAELLDLLIAQGEDSLSPAQRHRFARQRALIIPYLIRFVQDERTWLDDGPGGGWAAILAVRLLGELKATQAAETLVSVVADSRPEDVIHDAALFSLMAIGRPALSAVQTYFRYGRDVETHTSLAEVLGCIGRRSPDTFDLLRQVWEAATWPQNRRTVALAFGDLRDRRAIPLLQAALEDRAADALDLDYVHWALERLEAPAPPTKRPSRLETPAPYNPRLIYDESGNPQRLKHDVWGQPLCPDCGQPLVQDESGEWVHPPEAPVRRAAATGERKKRSR